jgi:hypothetical protein
LIPNIYLPLNDPNINERFNYKLQVASFSLFEFDRLEQRLEIALTKAFGALSLNHFEK